MRKSTPLKITPLGQHAWRVEWQDSIATFWINISDEGRLIAGIFKRKRPPSEQGVVTVDANAATNASLVALRIRQALKQLREEGALQ